MVPASGVAAAAGAPTRLAFEPATSRPAIVEAPLLLTERATSLPVASTATGAAARVAEVSVVEASAVDASGVPSASTLRLGSKSSRRSATGSRAEAGAAAAVAAGAAAAAAAGWGGGGAAAAAAADGPHALRHCFKRVIWTRLP